MSQFPWQAGSCPAPAAAWSAQAEEIWTAATARAGFARFAELVPAVGAQLVLDRVDAPFLDTACTPIVNEVAARKASNIAIYGAGPEGRAVARGVSRRGLQVACFVESAEGAWRQTVDGIRVCGIDECLSDGIDTIVIGSRRHADVMHHKTVEAVARKNKNIDVLLPTRAPAGPWWEAFVGSSESPAAAYPELWTEACDSVRRQLEWSLRDRASFTAAFLMGFYWPSAAAMVLARTHRIPLPDPAPFVYSMQ